MKILLLSVLAFGVLSGAFILAENRHFRAFGYHISLRVGLLALAALLFGFGATNRLAQRWRDAVRIWILYAVGVSVAVASFPLNYLRSDMLPVILWADTRLNNFLNPYSSMHVGARVYDFPYLPGMLLAYFPAVLFGIDPRILNVLYLGGLVWLFAANARTGFSQVTAGSLGLFLLCPFLQYRHDLYLAPHWLLLALAVFLLQRQRFSYSALSWGLGCALYQLSWILVPFVLLYGFRRRGWREVARSAVWIVLGFLCVAGPFFRVAFARIGRNTVEQWNHLPHALADPINLSYWLTFVIPPTSLKWVQAICLTTLFAFCVLRGQCSNVEDTLRWMVVALAVFIPLNILVDGYFYLTLLLLAVLFLCVANGYWRDFSEPIKRPLHAGLKPSAV